MDLLSLVLTLRPLQTGSLSPRLGRAAHAILLARLAKADPALAQTLHDTDGPKPFTCSDLMGPRQGPDRQVTPERLYALRYTALTAPTAARLETLFAPGDTLELETLPFTVESITADAAVSPWAGRDGYHELAARHLMPSGASPEPALGFLLAAPTAFQSQGQTLPLPLPEPFFGSLAMRWNAFAPLALPEAEVRRFAGEVVAISRFSLRSAPGWERGAGMRIGAIGRVVFRALNRDRYWLAVLHLLAAFARYSGVGAMTTMGMGQVRPLERKEREFTDEKDGTG